MASLTGNLIASSYLGLIKTVDNNPITSVTKSITDGAGNATALSLSTTTASIAGNLVVTGALNATASHAISASNADLLDGKDSTIFATTGSNTFVGDQSITGSIIPGGLTYDLGSLQNPWKELYVSTGSVNFVNNGAVVSTLNATTSSFNVSSNITVGNGGFEIGRGRELNVDTSVIIGAGTMTSAIGTAYSIGIGYQTMNNLVNGVSNIAIGRSAGSSLVNGNRNVLIGDSAGSSLSEQNAGVIPNENTYIGISAGQFHATGSQNTAVGAYALYGDTTAKNTSKLDNNTAIGRAAGSQIEGVSTNNIYIGAHSGPNSDTEESYKFYVGNGDTGQQPFMYGDMTNASRALSINAVLTVSSSLVLPPVGAPATPASGTIYFSSIDTHFYGWNGTTWKQLDN